METSSRSHQPKGGGKKIRRLQFENKRDRESEDPSSRGAIRRQHIAETKASKSKVKSSGLLSTTLLTKRRKIAPSRNAM